MSSGSYKYGKSAYAQSGLWLDQYKSSNPCVDCHQMFPSVCMDFDHLKDKKYNIAHMRTYPIASIKREVLKCDLVCSNCHRIRTMKRKLIK